MSTTEPNSCVNTLNLQFQEWCFFMGLQPAACFGGVNQSGTSKILENVTGQKYIATQFAMFLKLQQPKPRAVKSNANICGSFGESAWHRVGRRGPTVNIGWFGWLVPLLLLLRE